MRHIIRTEAEWLTIRKSYITASEAAVLVGADPYSSPSKLRNPSPFEGNAFTKVGQMLEPIVVNVTNEVLGLSGDNRFVLYENAKGYKEFYTKGPLGATPDAHMNRKILLEAKTTRPQTYIKYGAVPPSKYLIQQQVQMHCTGIDVNYLSIMSTNLTQHTQTLNWPVSVFKSYKDERICSILEEESVRFNEDNKFKINPIVKQKIKLLLSMCYEKVL